MMRGECVRRYAGKTGVTWAIRFADADGRLVTERLGPESDGWTRRKATRALRDRQADVKRDGWRKTAEGELFEKVADEWAGEPLDTRLAKGKLKQTTVNGYRQIVRDYLNPAFGHLSIYDLTDQVVEAEMVEWEDAGSEPGTINRRLSILSLICKRAQKRLDPRPVNPVPLVERPEEPEANWRILSPVEVRAIERAFEKLIAEAENEEGRLWGETFHFAFIVIQGTGMRLGELLGLHWRAVTLADPEGARLRIVETYTHYQVSTPKSSTSYRTLALGPRLAEEFFQHRARSAFDGEDERVFCNPFTGTVMDPKRYSDAFQIALEKAGITDHVRPFHDGRHSSLTNSAAAGMGEMALMTRAGHADFRTTKRYINLSGESFRDEAELLEERLWGKAEKPVPEEAIQ